jgi:hypothetical protein
MRRIIVLFGAFAPLVAGNGRAQDTVEAIEAARHGGVVIVCRHAITDHSQNEVEPVNYADSLTQRRLSEEGESQSRALGHALRALGIPIGELMLGSATIDSIWHTNGGDYAGPPLERRRRVLATPPDSGNLFIISHIGTIGSVLPGTADRLEEGDCIVVRPAAPGFDIVGIVPWQAWIRASGRS